MNACLRPTFSLLHATARLKPYPSFPHGWRDVYQAYFDACDHPEDVEYILAVHASRWDEFCNSPIEMGGAFPSFGSFHAVKNYGRDTCVDQLNVAAAASDGLVLHGVMDDMYPPAHWDTLIRAALPSLEESWLVNCATGGGVERDRALMIGGVWTRALYKRFGFILPPQFESMYADNFMAELHRAGRYVIERFDIAFDHRHPTFGKGEPDEIYALQNRPEAYASGLKALRAARAHAPESAMTPASAPESAMIEGNLVGAPESAMTAALAGPSDARSPSAGRSLALVMPGERFSWVWVSRMVILIEHLMRRGFRLTWPPCAGYSSNVYRTRGDLHEALLDLDPAPDFVFWLDDDNVVMPDQFDKLVADMDARPDLDLVCGWTFCGTDSYCGDYRSSVGRNVNGSGGVHLGPDELCSGRGLVDIDWTGFPCVLMRGATLRKAGPYPFDPLLGGPARYYGEDLGFCARLRANGGKLAVDPDVMVPHFKLRADAPPQVLMSLNQGLAAVGPGKR